MAGCKVKWTDMAFSLIAQIALAKAIMFVASMMIFGGASDDLIA